MKKLFNIFLSASLALVLATGCNDDDKYVVVDPVANMVKVVSRETTLPAAPSQGKVVVEADAPVTVTSTADGWLTTTVEGNTILLNADFNSSLESRSATLTIKSGTKESQIAVIQEGVIVDLDLSGATGIGVTKDAAQTFEYPLNSNCDVEFSTDADWIDVTEADAASGKVLIVSLDENKTGHMRKGNITYKAGPVEGNIPVSQYEFAKDIAGTYEFRYYSGTSKATMYKRTCTVSETSDGYVCSVVYSSTQTYDIPMTFDPEKCMFKIYAGQYLCMVNNRYAFTVIGAANSAGSLYVSYGTSYSTDGYVEYADGVTKVEFVDNGSWADYTFKYLTIRSYTTNPASGTATTLVNFYFPFLYREID